jgi:hypothetical protein
MQFNMNPPTFDPNIAHIRDGEDVYQGLNAEGTDWDEEATRAGFSTGITIMVTGGQGLTNNTAVTAGDVTGFTLHA